MSVRQTGQARNPTCSGNREPVRALFNENCADARHSRDHALTLGRAHHEQRSRQRVSGGTLRRDHRHAEQARRDWTARAWIEDVAVATAVALEEPFALARGADGALCDSEADERFIAIARI